MITIFIQSIRIFIIMTILTGLVYPVAVTLVGQGLFREKANSSIIKVGSHAIGSELLAQKFLSEENFWPRPSNSDYQSVPTGASNLGPTSQKLKDRVTESRKNFQEGDHIPYELLLTSGSGLDPHISPETAKFQAARVAAKRGLRVEDINNMIDQMTEFPTFGVLGRPRVNVLKLNLALKTLSQ